MDALIANYLFFFPLVMSLVWTTGALYTWFRYERHTPRHDSPPDASHLPPVSIIIPCFNEAAHIVETIRCALAVRHPDFEVIAVDDGSTDGTGVILDSLAESSRRLRVVRQAFNQGKAAGLKAGALEATHEILICIDGDARIDPHAPTWIAAAFAADQGLGAVTGNPRIVNRSTLLGRMQVGEFSAMIGIIKRAQLLLKRLFTVSGVIAAFRKSAVQQVDYWTLDALTDDIDMTWKLQRAGWRATFEPHALIWILTPETLHGLWRQRLRWAMGGAQVMRKNIDILWSQRSYGMRPLMLEMIASVTWCYLLAISSLVWLIRHFFMAEEFFPVATSGVILGVCCVVQFTAGAIIDRRYDERVMRDLIWSIWYPLAFWLLQFATTIVAYPLVLMRRRGTPATWVSPDRGLRVDR
jgi:biofilm PGA synthesis N-glycosyltransferase PgaC